MWQTINISLPWGIILKIKVVRHFLHKVSVDGSLALSVMESYLLDYLAIQTWLVRKMEN